MSWHENVEDFGEEIEPGATFRFECHPGLSCFGMCCATEITITPYDIARLRRHLGIDTHGFLSTYCQAFVDSLTGFPSVVLKHNEDGRCIFLQNHGCDIYESRPSCCRNYPLSKVIGDGGKSGQRLTTYYLQRRVSYCKGLGRGPEWTIDTYCEQNGLWPYQKANDVFIEIPFTYETLPFSIRHDKEVQNMIYQAVFDFDRFFEKYARRGPSAPPEDDHDMIAVLTRIVLNLINRTACL